MTREQTAGGFRFGTTAQESFLRKQDRHWYLVGCHQGEPSWFRFSKRLAFSSSEGKTNRSVEVILRNIRIASVTGGATCSPKFILVLAPWDFEQNALSGTDRHCQTSALLHELPASRLCRPCVSLGQAPQSCVRSITLCRSPYSGGNAMTDGGQAPRRSASGYRR